MQPELCKTVRNWLEKAAADLEMAQYPLKGGSPRTLENSGFHAQQTVEKSLKAFLTWKEITFEKTHDLGLLAEKVLSVEPSLKNELENVENLSPFAVVYRYPGEDEPPTLEEAQENFNMASRVYQRIRSALPKECLNQG